MRWLHALREHVGDAAYMAWEAMQPQKQLYALLDDHRWGKQAQGVDYIAQAYLSDIMYIYLFIYCYICPAKKPV